MCITVGKSCTKPYHYKLQLPCTSSRMADRHVKQSCLPNGRCLTKSIVYRAEVCQAGNDTVKMYTGLTEGTFKQRYNNHLSTFRHQKYENNTGLSKYIWQKKIDNEECDVKWSIVQRAKPYSNVSKRCDLCTTEKLKIGDQYKSVSLNNRSELVSKCRHKNKYILANVIPSIT